MTPDGPPDRFAIAAAVRELPDTPLRTVMLATLSEREPSRTECIAWCAGLAQQLKEPTNVGRP